MTNPLISIIIPTLNRAHLIGETLDSVLAQTYQHWECIIVDDGSTDNTDEVINAYVNKDSRFQYHHRPEAHKPGGNGARNYGFELSKGEFVNWFDSDDLMFENHLFLHLNNFKINSISASVSSGVVFTNTISNSLGKWSNINFKSNLIDDMISEHTLWPINGVIWERECIEFSPFDVRLVCSQEWVFHITQILKSVDYNLIPQNTCYVRRHQNRIGKIVSEDKTNSIYLSRKIIFEKLLKKKLLNTKRSYYLLKQINNSLKISVKNRYRTTEFSILKFLVCDGYKFKCRFLVFKTLFLAYPIYKVTNRGEKFFK